MPRASKPSGRAAATELTDREKAVKELLDTGLSCQEAATRLHLKAGAVYHARESYQRKLGVATPSVKREAELASLAGARPCPRCGLRGEHDCLKGDASARRVAAAE